MQDNIYTMQELERLYPNEWVLGDVVEADEAGTPRRLKLIVHSPSRDKIHERTMKVPEGAHVAVWFLGPPLAEGYEAAFLWQGIIS